MLERTKIRKPKQGLMQKILAGLHLHHSADIGTHYLKSLIELKYCLYELITASLLKKLINYDSKLSLGRNVEKLCSELKRLHPGISTRELRNLSNTIIENRHALTHGKMSFESKLHKHDQEVSVPLVDTTKITMKRGGLEIPLDQESLRKINNQFDKFFDLIIKLVIDLGIDDMDIYVVPEDVNKPAYKEKKLLRDILRAVPTKIERDSLIVGTVSAKDVKDINMPRYCRTCNRDFVGYETCEHLTMIEEILTGKETENA